MRVAVSGELEVATLTATRALVGAGSGSLPKPVPEPVPSPWGPAAELAPVLRQGRYVVLVADGEPEPDRSTADLGRSEALIALAHALNSPTRAALSLLRAGGNRSGADAVLSWQTGYPMSVDFSRGYPQYRPHDGSAASRLHRGEVDAVLVLGEVSGVPGTVVSLMTRLPCVVIGPRVSTSLLKNKDVVVDSAVAGIHEAGTAVRMDDVPLPLKSPLAGPATAAALAGALRERVVTQKR
jgi:formylmethanofuran dehydrogenase subunit B